MSYDEYIARIETRLTEDLIRIYPDAGIREDDATSMELRMKDEILSAMVVYGFLNCEDSYSIEREEKARRHHSALLLSFFYTQK